MANRRKGTNTGIPGLSFSCKRAFGVTNAKRTIARATGIPTTKSGRQRKLGRALGGCLLPVLGFVAIAMMGLIIFFKVGHG